MTKEERQGLTRLVEALFLEVLSLQAVLIEDHPASDWEFRKNTILDDPQVRIAVRERFRTVYEGIAASVDDSRFVELLSIMPSRDGADNVAA